MWLEKEDDVKYETITFAGVGVQCFSQGRSMGTGGDFLDDPTIFHDQITDYVDVYDVYGNMDYDPGHRCTYGVTEQASRPVHKYFSKIVGYAGAVLMASSSLPKVFSEEIDKNFMATRYFTHFSYGQAAQMNNPLYLLPDGTTDGGCQRIEPVVADNKCPLDHNPTATAYDQTLCCMEDLVGDYGFAASFARDAYIDRAVGDVVTLSDVFPTLTSPQVCPGVQATVVQSIHIQDSLDGYGAVPQGTDATIYQLLPESTNTFIVAFRGSEGESCLTVRVVS
jgi:hypothetical protein